MLLKRYGQYWPGWLSCYLIMASLLWSCSLLLPSVHADDAPALLDHFNRLYKHYSSHSGSITSDCKVKADKISDMKSEEDPDPDHIHWGTLETLRFLSGNMAAKDQTLAETRTNLAKLRQFLSRVGYLKEPGSLIFLDKQTLTIRLTGCKEGSVWRRQGQTGEKGDKYFQQKYYTGDTFKDQTPSASNYIHKFTCFKTGSGKCSHTFYVISKLLPELPFGLLIRESRKDDVEDTWEFACSVPYCRLKNCMEGKEKIPLRSYPPFKIYWDVPKPLAKSLGQPYSTIVGEGVVDTKEVKFVWSTLMRKKKDADLIGKDNFVTAAAGKYNWKDGFGVAHTNPATQGKLQSRIRVRTADENTQPGTYECVIEDANGVVSTPNHVKKDYRGKANIHIIYDELYYAFAGAAGACLITALIILACPKKMEYDDGTRYTKEELMPPTQEQAGGEAETKVEAESSAKANAGKVAGSEASVAEGNSGVNRAEP